MPKNKKLFFQISLLLYLLTIAISNICAQQKIIDSLENVLKENQLTKHDRLKTLNLLTKCYIAEDKDESYDLADNALALARGESNVELKLAAYINKVLTLEMKDSIQASYYMIDTCMQYIAELGNVPVKAKALLNIAKIKYRYQDESDILPVIFEALDIAKKMDNKSLQISIYLFLANTYYGRLNNIENMRKYAELAYNIAESITDNEAKVLSCQSMGFMYRQTYAYSNRSKEYELYLDSAIVFLKKSTDLSDSMEGYIPLSTNLNSLGHLISTYTFKTYTRNDSTFYIYPDSVLKYSNILLDKAQEANRTHYIIGAYRFLSGYESNRKNFTKAEDILIKALNMLENDERGNEQLQSKYLLCLSLVYQLKITEKYEKALEYMEEAYTYQNNLFQKKHIRGGQIAEAKYKVKEKESALMLSLEESRRHKQFLIGSVVSAIMILAFLFIFYQMRIRNVKQKAHIHQKEKEEIRLQALLKEKELQQSESEKKTLELEKELEKERAERQALEISRLQTELIAGISQLEQKNDTLDKIKQTIGRGNKIENDELKELLLTDRIADKSFSDFSDLLEKTHSNFYFKLQERTGQKLTQLDLKYCTYIMMNFTSKEIANIMHVDPNTVRTTKYRLKRKLNLSKEEDLSIFIKKIAQDN